MSEELLQRIASGQARVGVVGLGYVGLPLAVEFASKGLAATGFDVSARRVADVNAGRSYIPDVAPAVVRRLAKEGRLRATADFNEIRKQDAVLLCVPTPLRKTRDPDVSHILAAVGSVAPRLKKGALVVLESTTYPGTTRELVLPLLERGGRREGRDFFLAFSPERVDPGNPLYRIPNTPKVVGGLSEASSRAAAALYGRIVEKVVPVSSAEAAEMVKLLENTFRAVNIGLINEVALMCDRLGLDVWEIVDAAKSKPFGYMPFYPGPGLGGHCIPVDPHYLAWKMRSLHFEARFIELAGTINGSMPEHVVARCARLLNRAGKPLKGSRILALGVAYKAGVSDVRESPALDVLKLLSDEGAKVSFHDPYVERVELPGLRLKGRPLSDAALRQADLVLILTAHGGIDYRAVAKKSRRVFDTRNSTQGVKSANVERL